ncbi:Transposase DDE domain [Actinomyces howellii]|uniref:Transposase DDE domain n=1 Tax=Actinomyces howellii TaxID=52771 RepID=A0A3S4RAJ8_9ACTO|nr:Transposase DDE domain [Actinomyces howellii]
MDTDLETLATSLYVTVDDLLKAHPEVAPQRPEVGIAPAVTDAEVITLAVMQALLGHASERRWLRHARKHLSGMFPRIPGQSGWNKRLRALQATMAWLISTLARSTSTWSEDLWLADSTPVECARSRPTVRRSDLAGWAGYGYCASHSRWFWGLRLHMVTTPDGLPVTWALTSPTDDEREVLRDMLARLPATSGQALLTDKGYRSKKLETELDQWGVTLVRPAARGEAMAAFNVLFGALGAPRRARRGPQTRQGRAGTPAPENRARLRHPQGPAVPGTPQGPHPSRRDHPSHPTRPRPDRSHLAQPPHRRTSPALTDRLRPLTPPWSAGCFSDCAFRCVRPLVCGLGARVLAFDLVGGAVAEGRAETCLIEPFSSEEAVV